MTKRILLALLVAALPALAHGQTADRDTLLTPDGTLYTVEAVFADGTAGGPAVQTTSSEYLLLSSQQGTTAPVTVAVPGSLTGGQHSSPALAIDSDTGTLFVFWEQAINNRQSTSLLFASYSNGAWGETAEIDPANYRLRHNLQIAVTHKTQDLDKPGQPSYNELNVHAIWWEEAGGGQWARYAMLTIANGSVSAVDVRDVSSLVSSDASFAQYQVPSDFNPEILRHPQVFESTTHDTVDLVFGNLDTNGLERITVKPAIGLNPSVNLRIRIPIGIRDGHFPPPQLKDNSLTGTIAAVPSADYDRLMFYSPQAKSVNYTMFKDGVWTPILSIVLNDKVTSDVAVNAVRRLAASE